MILSPPILIYREAAAVQALRQSSHRRKSRDRIALLFEKKV